MALETFDGNLLGVVLAGVALRCGDFHLSLPSVKSGDLGWAATRWQASGVGYVVRTDSFASILCLLSPTIETVLDAFVRHEARAP